MSTEPVTENVTESVAAVRAITGAAGGVRSIRIDASGFDLLVACDVPGPEPDHVGALGELRRLKIQTWHQERGRVVTCAVMMESQA